MYFLVQAASRKTPNLGGTPEKKTNVLFSDISKEKEELSSCETSRRRRYYSTERRQGENFPHWGEDTTVVLRTVQVTTQIVTCLSRRQPGLTSEQDQDQDRGQDEAVAVVGLGVLGGGVPAGRGAAEQPPAAAGSHGLWKERR